MSGVTQSALIDAARSLLGVPFHHQGRNEHGIDCIGLVLLACKRAGADLEDFGFKAPRNYGRRGHPDALKMLGKFCVRNGTAVPGCLIAFQFPREKSPNHYGLMTDVGTFVHAHASGPVSARRVIESGYRARWVSDTHSFWLLPGIHYEIER